jgi:O-antigen/teichoic acid export membrane protein
MFTAAKERADNSGKEGILMNRRSDLIAVLCCVAIIVIAFLTLRYGRRNEVGSILVFGYVLDALITTGVVGNVFVFLVTKITKRNPLRIALWTLGVVHVVLLLLAVLIASRVAPAANLVAVVIGYLVSFVIWAGLHYAWRHRPPVYS